MAYSSAHFVTRMSAKSSMPYSTPKTLPPVRRARFRRYGFASNGALPPSRTSSRISASSVGQPIEVLEGPIRYLINEFWTSGQRQAHSIHEVSYRACFKPQLPEFFIERLTRPGDAV